MNVNQMIALNLIQAQMASDAGKGKQNLSINDKLNRGALNLGYAIKERYILNVIKLIRNNKTQFNYWVSAEPDQNGYESVVVYFDFKIDGKRYQISFHNHNSSKELKSFVNTGRKTRWNKKIGGSIIACSVLREYYKLPVSNINNQSECPNNVRNSERRRRG